MIIAESEKALKPFCINPGLEVAVTALTAINKGQFYCQVELNAIVQRD